jgi:hypothetical protein
MSYGKLTKTKTIKQKFSVVAEIKIKIFNENISKRWHFPKWN